MKGKEVVGLLCRVCGGWFVAVLDALTWWGGRLSQIGNYQIRLLKRQQQRTLTTRADPCCIVCICICGERHAIYKVRLFLTLHLDLQPLLVLYFTLERPNLCVFCSHILWFLAKPPTSSSSSSLPPTSYTYLPLRQRPPTNWCTGSTTSSLACDL